MGAEDDGANEGAPDPDSTDEAVADALTERTSRALQP